MKLKKVLAILASSALMLSFLAACGSDNGGQETTSNTDTESSADTAPESTGGEESEDGEAEVDSAAITLTVWAPQEDQVAYEGYDQGIITYLCEEFAQAHPEYNITFKYGVVAEGDVNTELTKDSSAAADVFMLANDQISGLVESGNLARFGGDILSEIEANVSDSMLGSVTYNDGVYGVPYTTNTYFMYYDTSLYTEEEVKSLETMMAKDLGDGVSNFSMDLDNSWYIPGFFYAAGGELFGPDGSDNDAGTTFGDHPEATEYMINLFNNEKFHLEDDNGSGIAKFEDGKLGAFVSGSWSAATIKEYLGDNYGVTKLPTVNLNGEDSQLMSFAGSKVVAVNSSSQNLAVAMQLAAYLGGEEAQTVRYETRGYTPTWSSVESLPEIQADVTVAAEILQINEASKTQPLVKLMTGYWTAMEALGKGIVQGDITLENYVESTTTMGDTMNNQ